MTAYIIRRLLQLILVLFGVTLITFSMLKLVPGDPAVALAGKGASPERIAYIREQRGLDRPFYVQYVRYVERLAHGDLGESLFTGRSVRDLIREAAPVTIQLAVAAVLIELLGIPLGVYSALRQYSFWDTTLTTAALIIWGIPVFVLGYFAMYIFGLKLNWLPIGGVGPTVLGIIPPPGRAGRRSSCLRSRSASSRWRTSRTCSAPPCSRCHAPTSSAPRGPRASASARSSGATASRTPSSRS